MLKYKYIFKIKYTETILSNTTQELLWFEISKMQIGVLQNKFIVLFIIICGTLSFPMKNARPRKNIESTIYYKRLKKETSESDQPLTRTMTTFFSTIKRHESKNF